MAGKLVRGVALALLVACSAQAGAQAGAQGDTARRPRIGLVLGGGGARGTAHVGVLEVMQQLRVPVDCVAGTSMGSLIGGAWVSGLTPQEMTAKLSQVDWSDLFQDNPARAETNYRERRLDQTYYPGLELGVTPRGLQAAHGVVGGQKIKLFFNTLVGADRGERNIENLPLPFSVITTDIGSGEKVVLRSGELSSAMRASMSVPVLLAPLRYQGRALVDGGLVDNLPVDEVRARCNADVVIAVDVGSPLTPAEAVNSIGAVSGQMINILTEQNANASRASLKPTDIYIKPGLADFTAADFPKFREGVEWGRKAALAVAPQLQRYSVSEDEYRAWSAKLRTAAGPLPRIDAIELTGLTHVNPAVIYKYLRIRPGMALDIKELERDIARMYGEGDFQSIDYVVEGTPEHRVLRLVITEKAWGVDYLRLGIELQASGKENNFALRAAFHRKWINDYGAEWLSGVQLGERTSIFTDFYQPLDPRQWFFVEPTVSWARDKVNVYQNDQRLAEYRIKTRSGIFNAGANVSVYGQVRLGWLVRHVEASVETGSPTLPAGENTLKGWQLLGDFDQFDRTFFPTRGWSASGRYFKENDLDYSRLQLELRGAYPWREYVFNGRIFYLGSPQGKLPLADTGALGGFLNLSGFVRNQVLAGDIRFGSIRAEKVIGHMPLGIAGDLRVGLSLETGRARDRFTETQLTGWQHAGALYLGGETPLGPVYVAYGYAKGGHNTYYLFLGLP
jgi:NTE family protein